MTNPEGLLRTPFSAMYPADLETEWIDVYGYAVPLWIGDPADEYAAFRERVGILEYSMLYKWDLRGTGAVATANSVFSRDLVKLAPGRIAYGVVTDADGLMIDDCTATMLAADHVLLCGGNPLVGNLLRERLPGDTTMLELREGLAVASVQGPRSRELLQRLTEADLSNEALPYYSVLTDVSLAGIPATISRLGFTAELGYEVMVPIDRAADLWNALFESGEDLGVTACAAAALMMARIEAGMVMGEVEYDHTVTPFECRMGWAVDFNKGEFLGRESLLAKKDSAEERVVTVRIEGDADGLDGAPLTARDNPVGFITMAVPSPVLDGATLGMARVHRSAAEVGTALTVTPEAGQSRTAEVVSTPVYDPERLRVRS
jgi:aminomethyltransferase